MIEPHFFGADSRWPSVDRDVYCYSVGLELRFVSVLANKEYALLHTTPLPELTMWQRHLVLDDRTMVAFKGNASGALRLVTIHNDGRVEPESLGPTYGDPPIAMGWANGRPVMRWVKNKTQIGGMWLDTMAPWPDELIPAILIGTSQGLEDILPDGSVIYRDLHRIESVAVRVVAQPAVASCFANDTDGTATKEAQTGEGIVMASALESTRVFPVLPVAATGPMAEDPRVALSAAVAGRALVCSYTTNGAALGIVDMPYPAGQLPGAPLPPVVPPIDRPPMFPTEPSPKPPIVVPPRPVPVPPSTFQLALGVHVMNPFAAAFRAGIYYARIDRHGTTPFGAGWFPVRFDRTDSSDPDCHFTVSQLPGGPTSAGCAGSKFSTADFTGLAAPCVKGAHRRRFRPQRGTRYFSEDPGSSQWCIEQGAKGPAAFTPTWCGCDQWKDSAALPLNS